MYVYTKLKAKFTVFIQMCAPPTCNLHGWSDGES